MDSAGWGFSLWCQLGCGHLRALLGCRSKMAKSHAWQLVLAIDGSLVRPTYQRLCLSFLLSFNMYVASSVQFSCSVMSDSLWSHESQHARPPLSITNSRSLLRLMSIESVMPSNHLSPCRPLLLLPPTPPSIRVFSNESTFCIRWSKYWSFSFSISPFNEHPGLISFRMDCLDLLAVQGTLKSLLQHHSSKALIFQRSAFFTVQFSHLYMTTG